MLGFMSSKKRNIGSIKEEEKKTMDLGICFFAQKLFIRTQQIFMNQCTGKFRIDARGSTF